MILAILYNVRTRALHRHPPFLEMWEWVWWAGLITFSLILVESLFVFDLFLVLLTEAIGLATLVWIRFIRFPPMLEAYQARLAKERYFTQAEVQRPGGDHQATRQQPPTPSAADASRRPARCPSRSAASASVTGARTGRRVRSA